MDINKIVNIKNPQFTKDGDILLTIDIEGIGKDIPFIASKNDTEDHGKLLFKQATSGKFGTIKQYTE